MASDSDLSKTVPDHEASKAAYIAYVKEKGCLPKNATQLLNFCKLHDPPFIGINYKTARNIVAHPPTTAPHDDCDQSTGLNPYIDDTLKDHFISSDELIATKCNIETIYNLYREEKGSYPSNPSRLLSFCKLNNMHMTYLECSQFISSQHKDAKRVHNRKHKSHSSAELDEILKSRMDTKYDSTKFESLEKPIISTQKMNDNNAIDYSGRNHIGSLEKEIVDINVKQESVIDYSGRKQIKDLEKEIITVIKEDDAIICTGRDHIGHLEKHIVKENANEESKIDYSGRQNITNLEKQYHTDVKTTFIKTSAIKKQHYTQFPSLRDYAQQMNHGDKTQMKEVRQYTDCILSNKPSGDPSDKNTLLHILSGVANENGKQCLFYDSSKHQQSKFMANSYLNMVDGNDDESANFVLTLKHLDDFMPDENDDAKHATDRVDKIMKLKEALSNNQYNETIEDIRRKLSIAHQVAVTRIVITDIYHNGAGIAYRVRDLSDNEKNNIITQTQKLENKMKTLFVDYDKCAIHPALFHHSYDISMFDELGNKTFGSSENSTYKVGPSGKERDYVQPAGWTRYGLKVLNKYPPDNKWLDPFQDPCNWYRAFHGTSREAGSSIYKGAFRSGSGNAYGKGIYCSPDVNIAADYCRSRGGIITLETKKGMKDFYFVFQVAVNPDTMNNAAYIPNFDPSCETAKYWIAPTGADIRPYGILIKEV